MHHVPCPTTVATPIVAFAKDHNEDPTSNHHVLHELAKTRRVLWLNSVGTRTPKLSSGRDLGKIKRKIAEAVRGAVNVQDDLWVATPLVLPLPHSAVARALNQQILRTTVRLLRMRLGIDKFQLWTFLPNVADYVGTLGEELSIYYCVDEWSLFSYLDKGQTVAQEKKLLAKVDGVFAINGPLADAKRLQNPATFVAPHGVDHALFARALAPETELPADLAALPGPRIGFYGTLRDWVDLELVAEVARARPQWSFALLGQQLGDMSAVAGIPNVHLLGQKKHGELPAYCKGFDVGIIPYKLDERMTFVNPLKLREYLSAGLPVVSTAVPEVLRYRDRCHVATGAAAWIAAIEAALTEGSPEARLARSRAMTDETWVARVANVARIVDELEHGPRLAETVPFLVTGAGGRLGGAVVRRLRAEGHRVRGFVRTLPEAPIDGVEYAVGDLADADAVDRAVRGAETVIHAGAATRGSWEDHRRGTVVGTQHVIDACRAHGVKQLVHISSMSVVDWAGSEGHDVDEHTPLEPRATERGAYTRAKLEAEQLVAGSGLPSVILRPGQIFGGGIELLSGAVARRAAGRWLVLGDGQLELPLVYVDDVVDGIIAAVDRKLAHGEVIQLIDPDALTQNEVLELAGGGKQVVALPRALVFALGKLSELPMRLLGRQSPIAAYRLKSALARLHYESERAQALLGWYPRVGVREGIARLGRAT